MLFTFAIDITQKDKITFAMTNETLMSGINTFFPTMLNFCYHSHLFCLLVVFLVAPFWLLLFGRCCLIGVSIGFEARDNSVDLDKTSFLLMTIFPTVDAEEHFVLPAIVAKF